MDKRIEARIAELESVVEGNAALAAEYDADAGVAEGETAEVLTAMATALRTDAADARAELATLRARTAGAGATP
jgi:hypothetical protein